jgi:ATP-binding cassette subfamily B (MDR/TAP) protein 1
MGGVIGAIGSGSVFPVQAVIFSRAILLFQLPLPEDAHKMKTQGSFWGLMYLALALGVLMFYAASGFCFTATAFHVSTFYRSRYFAAPLGQDIGFCEHEGHTASAATSRLSTDPQLLQDLIATNLGFILLSLVNVIASCTLALAVGWKIAIVAIFGCLPPIFFAGFVRMRIEMTSQNRMSKI